jgi:hypothetical protein
MAKLNPREAEKAPEADSEEVPQAEGPVAKTRRRNPSALIEEFDFTDAVDKNFRAKGKKRESKWAKSLTKLYDATAEGRVPRGEDGALQFIRVGNYQSRNGAQQQAKALRQGVGETYEFKVVGSQDGSAGLYARVKELPVDSNHATPQVDPAPEASA